MKKINIIPLAFGACILLTDMGCSKDKGKVQPAPEIVDAKSLSANLNIEGSKRKSGEIPSPTSASYPIGLTINTPSVIITPGNTFDFELESPDDLKGMIVFIKIDGTDEYFEVTMDKNGNIANKTTTARRGLDIGLKAQPAKLDNMDVDATVQIYQPDKQTTSGMPDLSQLNDWKYWSPKKKIKFKTFNTGTGDIFATLTWNKTADIDLWMREPNGNKIYYANKISSTGGELDYDNTYAFGPENIFYETTPPSGKYEVWVHYYSGSDGPVNWVVSLKNGQASTNFRGTLGNIKDSMLVTTFTK